MKTPMLVWIMVVLVRFVDLIESLRRMSSSSLGQNE